MKAIEMEIRKWLEDYREDSYANFISSLVPHLMKKVFFGVRMPLLRKYAKEIARRADKGDFLDGRHEFFEENQLHALLLVMEKDFAACRKGVDEFLPQIDNWAVCDLLSPKCFRMHRRELWEMIPSWLALGGEYRIRFGIKMLMEHFLQEDFDPRALEQVAQIRSDAYYVNMMRAWFFAEALAVQYEKALPYIEEGRLDLWTHRKAIQKAVESRKISEERKEILKSFRKARSKKIRQIAVD